MDDEKFSGEGAQPPSIEPVRRRRNRKLSGVAAAALGELAYALYVAHSGEGDLRANVRDAMLKWRARYLP